MSLNLSVYRRLFSGISAEPVCGTSQNPNLDDLLIFLPRLHLGKNNQDRLAVLQL